MVRMCFDVRGRLPLEGLKPKSKPPADVISTFKTHWWQTLKADIIRYAHHCQRHLGETWKPLGFWGFSELQYLTFYL